MHRPTEAAKTSLEWDEKLFLAVVAYLVIRGLLKASDATDRRRVQETYAKLRQGKLAPRLTDIQRGYPLC